MINLLIGPPGGGKSYEAVVFHVLPTLEQGRKVITNLPLNIAEIAKIEPRAPALIEMRTKSRKAGCEVFGDVSDYGDDWRDPETGQGALYVIDECHKPLPRGSTPRTVDEWYAEHRHEGADVLLMTQSYGKISKAITDQVQTLYRVKKMTVFGKPTHYIRKVQDGVRGEVMSTAERKYEERFYKLYKSHTRSLSAVLEADARDISPAYKQFYRASIVVTALGCSIGLYQFFKSDEKGGAKEKLRARTQEHAQRSTPAPPSTVAPVPAAPQLSTTWRIVGSWSDPFGLVYFVSDGVQRLRLPNSLCPRDEFGAVVCTYAGELVTYTSGPGSSRGLLSTFVAGPVPAQESPG